MKILVIDSIGLGDFISSLPALRKLQEKFHTTGTEVETTVAVQSWVVPFVKQLANVDQVIPVQTDLWSLVKEGLRLRAKKYDLVFVPHPARKNTILSLLSRKRRLAGYRVYAASELYSGRENEYCYLKGFRQIESGKIPAGANLYKMAFTILNLIDKTAEDKIKSPFIIPREGLTKRAHEELKSIGLKPRSYVVLHAFSSKETKNWTKAHIVRFIELTWQTFALPVLLIGDAKDQEKIAEITAAVPEQSRAWKSSLDLLIGILQETFFFVGADSGPLHIAMGLNVPSIGLFGRTGPGIVFPEQSFNEKSFQLYKAFNCPCTYNTCTKQNHCMELIQPDEVVDKMKDLLKK